MTRRLLAIESATDWLSIALLEDRDVLRAAAAADERQHAAQLMPLIAREMDAVGWSVEDLDALAVSTGPGSFTSLRIGLATAKGLAFGRDWRGVAVSTLEAMAVAAFEEGQAPEGAVVLTLLDARRGEWYAGAWRHTQGAAEELECVLAEGLYAPEPLVADLACPVVVVTPDATDWRAGFEPAGLVCGDSIEGVAARPRAEWVGRLGAARLARGEGVRPSELSARYLRRAQAEAVRLGGPVEAGELARVVDGDL